MKPYIVCHMLASIDGRIDCDMTEQIESGDEYYEALAQLNCPSMLMGRVTMQMHYAEPDGFNAKDPSPIGHASFHVAQKTGSYCIAVDTHGKLAWGSNEFDNQHLLVITSENCPKEYHDALTSQGISWIAIGEDRIDLSKAINILHDEFGVERLAITGGGNINAAFLEAGLLDEISFMVAPGIDGRAGMTAAFDGIQDASRPATKLKLTSVEQIGAGTVWMRYKLQ